MDWSSIGAAGISAIGGYLTAENTNGMKLRDAVRAREWQEYMYNKSMRDMRTNWQLEQAYNTPLAQLNRIKQAGMNPLLLYGQGGVSNVATNSIGSGQMPNSSFGERQAADLGRYLLSGYEQMKMLQAQTKLMESQANKTDAETEQTKSMTDWQEIENKFSRESYEIRMAIQHGNLEQIHVNLEKMRNEIANSSMLTSQQLQTMIQARLYEIKRFDLDKETYGANVQQGWKHLANEAVSVRAQYKNAAAAWLNAQTQANLSKWQIGAIAQDILYRSQEQPLKMKRLSLDNALVRWDTHLKRAALNEKQRNIVNQELKNYYLKTYGSESVPQGHLYKEVAPWVNNLTNSLEFMFVYPNQGK